MKNEKVSCAFWLLVFLALWFGAGWFVHRRVPDISGAVFGGLVGAILLLLTFSWLFAIPGRINELLLIVRTKLGREPQDGKRGAVIGTLRGYGELTAPLSRERCVAYEYDIHTRVVNQSSRGTSVELKKAYEGFGMVPLSIEHGTERTRILTRPEMKMRTTDLSPQALAHAKELVASTDWQDEPAPSKDQPDLSHTDGHYRRNSRLRTDANLDECTFAEKVHDGNVSACAIGEYSADRRALVAPVTLRTGQSSFVIGAAWRVVNAGIGLVIFAAITLAAATFFCLNYPLDARESSSPDWTLTWPEIELERFLEKEVRTRMVEAGMLSSTSGFYLQDVCMNCAKGEMIADGRKIELKHAAEIGPRTIHLSATPGGRDGLTLFASNSVTVTLNGKAAPIPSSWLLPNDIVTALGSGSIAEYAGRITIVAPDRWLRARVTFKTRVNADAWLPARTPPDPQ